MNSSELTTIEINLNGKKEHVPSNISVKALLLKKNINPNVVACELNVKILRRAQLDQHHLKEGDTLEIIQMIGGG